MATPTPEQLDKLPKWVKHHIRRIEQDRDEATSRLDEYLDGQTPSKVYYEDMSGREGFMAYRKYIQSRRVTFVDQGVELTVMIAEGLGRGIELSWGPERCHGLGDLCFIPTSYQQARITNMAYTPHEYRRLVDRREKFESEKTGESDEQEQA